MESKALQTVRRGMLGLVLLGTAGIFIELLVLQHYGDPNQLIPLVVAGAGLVTLPWVGAAPSLVALRIWQFAMLLFLGTGLTGITMHAEFVSETVNPPLLAPALFIHLGLLGLLFTYRHPSLAEDFDMRP